VRACICCDCCLDRCYNKIIIEERLSAFYFLRAFACSAVASVALAPPVVLVGDYGNCTVLFT
jgi:hypothetical protein